MSGAFAAATILFLVYVSQCFGSAPPTTVLFLLNDRLRGRLLRRYWETGPAGRRIFLLNPFLPQVGAVYADRFPFIVRLPETGGAVSLAAHPAVSDSPRALTFDSRSEVEAFGKDVVVDGEQFASLRSESAAEAMTAFLETLQNTTRESRLEVLENHFRQRFDLEALDQRLERYRQGAAYLHTACFSLFFFVLLLAPAAVFFLGLNRTWFALLLYLVFAGAAVVCLYVAAYRKIYPREKRWPLLHMTTIGFSPFSAIRANDLLVAELAAEFHPLAVGQRLLQKEEFLSLAAGELRRARFLDRDEFLVRFLSEFLEQNG
ncbi:MAG TPA: hypothetical protein VKB24_00450, partial [Candidatus Acidoferrum sp.]|nr:hypothetical protein [Candidatus Acidoferrum sp.]